jgi:N-acylglucosamine-6-phosphate 2-epimerase
MTTGSRASVLRRLKNGLIVSCQPSAASPLNLPQVIAAMAQAAKRQGAAGVRINGVKNIQAVRRRVTVPIIGIEKKTFDGSAVYITPTLDSVRRVHAAGAQIIAIDCTDRPRPKGESLQEILRHARTKLGATVMADIATFDQALAAVDVGADLVATTLHGYTEEIRESQPPAFDLLRRLVRKLRTPVVLEGRVRTPAEVRRAFDLGAYAVVVGTAITDMEWIVERFVEATPRAND